MMICQNLKATSSYKIAKILTKFVYVCRSARKSCSKKWTVEDKVKKILVKIVEKEETVEDVEIRPNVSFKGTKMNEIFNFWGLDMG